VEPYRSALKCAFFEPADAIVRLYNRFNAPLKCLVDEWWDKVETSKKFAQNRPAILAYEKKLKPGEITLVGLIAEGGQGMRTANNGRFLGYLKGTPQEKDVLERRQELTREWEKHPRVGPIFKDLLGKHRGDFESVIEPLKEQFDWSQDLGLRRGEIYRIVPTDCLANPDDFTRAFEFRKAELQKVWTETKEVTEYYKELDKEHAGDFFRILEGLMDEAERKSFASAKLGLRSGEFYGNPSDAPRIASIHSGLVGTRTWVPFRKGDPEGHKWTSLGSLCINWDTENVRYLQTSAEARWQGYAFFFLPGVTWTLHANHVGLKARLQPVCVFDASGSRLTPMGYTFTANQFLAMLNADLFSFIIKKFIKNTQDYEVNDLRMAPIVVPNRSQGKELETLATWAIKAKELSLNGSEPSVELVAFSKKLAEGQISAPRYLQPNPQLLLVHTADDCLAIIELAINWAVERLYGVEGLGPFNEF
jgi:hypothetical protein